MSISNNLTDDEIVAALKAGTPLVFSKPTSGGSQLREIKAEWIIDLVSDEQSIKVPIRIENAIISGLLQMPYIDLRSSVGFINTEFQGIVDFSFCTFHKAAQFEACTFREDCAFRSARTAYDFVIRRSVFAGRAFFVDMHVAEGLMCVGAEFQDAYFDRIDTGCGAFFGADDDEKPVVFHGEASFHTANIFELIASNAIFEARALFDGMTVRGRALFQDARFAGEARFTSAAIHGNFEANGAQFGGELHFDRARIEGGAYFQATQAQKPLFGGPAIFHGCAIRGQAVFADASFKKEGRFANLTVDAEMMFVDCKFDDRATFERSVFKSDLSFLKNIEFAGETTFVLAQVQGGFIVSGALFRSGAYFDGIQVNGPSYFNKQPSGNPTRWEAEASFTGAKLKQQAVFEGAVFSGESHFITTEFGSDASFINATFGGAASFDRAQIVGSAYFGRPEDKQHAVFDGAARFFDMRVAGSLNISFVEFRQQATFDNVAIGKDTNATGAVFHSNADFIAGRFGAQCAFQGCVFKGRASFNRAAVDGSLYFRPEDSQGLAAARFEGEANFVGLQAAGQVHFRKVVFSHTAGPVSFDGAHIRGPFSFMEVQVAPPLRFLGVSVERQAAFQGTRFDSSVDFDSAKIGGHLLFRPEGSLPATLFKSEVRFNHATVGGLADFRKVEFKGAAQFKLTRFDGGVGLQEAVFDNPASFRGAMISQYLHFESAQFAQTAEFDNVSFNGESHFSGTVFQQNCSFDSAVFCGLANFSSGDPLSGTHFNAVSFTHAEFKQNAQFQETVFKGNLSLAGATFKGLLFSSTGMVGNEMQFQSGVDLKGCTYESIQTVWQSVLRYPDDRTRLITFDRQPYIQLENSLRSSGKDREADDVFLERRRVERIRKRATSLWSWLLDCVYLQFANYGVRPYQLLWICVIALTFGTMTFEMPGAVRKDSGKVSGKAGQVSVPPLTGDQAFRIGLRSFLPVELPLSPDLTPSEGRLCRYVYFRDIAALLKFCGWILVPIGLAAVTGLLKKASQ